MNKHKKFIKDAYEGKYGEMCQDWKDTILEHYPEFEKDKWNVDKFKVGDWIYFPGDTYPRPWRIIEKTKHTLILDDFDEFPISHFENGARKATLKEIEKYLIEEAKKRGLHNNEFKSLSKNTVNNVHDINKWYYCEEKDTLYSAPKGCGGKAAYKQGKWAEKIQTMTKEEAEEKLGCKIV